MIKGHSLRVPSRRFLFKSSCTICSKSLGADPNPCVIQNECLSAYRLRTKHAHQADTPVGAGSRKLLDTPTPRGINQGQPLCPAQLGHGVSHPLLEIVPGFDARNSFTLSWGHAVLQSEIFAAPLEFDRLALR